VSRSSQGIIPLSALHLLPAVLRELAHHAAALDDRTRMPAVIEGEAEFVLAEKLVEKLPTQGSDGVQAVVFAVVLEKDRGEGLRRFGMTRSILEELASHSGFDVSIISKSDMILRDLELFQKIAAQNNLSINLTVTTLDAELARLLEPRAPRPDLRLNAVRKFNDAGLSAGVAIAPVLPGITDSPKQLDALVKAAAEAQAQWIFANPLFLKPCSEKVFMPFLAEHFPALVESYKQRFANNAFLPAAYKKQISTLVRKLKSK